MTADEYKGLLGKMIESPDSAEETAKSILEEIGKDIAERTALEEETKKQTEEKDAKIADLTKTVNHYKAQEFMQTIGQPAQKVDPKQAASDILATLFKPQKEDK